MEGGRPQFWRLKSPCSAKLCFCSPLHSPDKPTRMRTAHFPALQTPALFIHGTQDPFGSTDEMTAALQPIPSKTKLITIEGAGHDLKGGKFDGSVWDSINDALWKYA
jgi:predicted alpha/beta-hydrolase family hydrolase